MLKFCEFLHRIRVIFYLRFRPLDVPMYAFGTKNEDFRSKSPYPLNVSEGSSNFDNLSYPLLLIFVCIFILPSYIRTLSPLYVRAI